MLLNLMLVEAMAARQHSIQVASKAPLVSVGQTVGRHLAKRVAELLLSLVVCADSGTQMKINKVEPLGKVGTAEAISMPVPEEVGNSVEAAPTREEVAVDPRSSTRASFLGTHTQVRTQEMDSSRCLTQRLSLR